MSYGVPSCTSALRLCCRTIILISDVSRRQAALVFPFLKNLHGSLVPTLLDLVKLSELKSTILVSHIRLDEHNFVHCCLTSWTGICMYKHPWEIFASSSVLTLDTLHHVEHSIHENEEKVHELG